MTPSVHHISFATDRYRQAARLLARSAERFGVPKPRVYTPHDTVITGLADRYPDVMDAKRGAGYWLWKPFILRDALDRASDGTIVLYTDAAVIYVADPGPLFDLTTRHPIVLFEMMPKQAMRAWTKRDCFVALDADTPAFWDLSQVLGGFQIYRAGPEARAFVEALCEASALPGLISDAPNTRGLPNLPEFVAHRHDQSILTIVARQHDAPVFPDPSQWGPGAPRKDEGRGADGFRRPAAPYGQIFDVHRKKNWAVGLWSARRALRRMVAKDTA